MANSAADIQKLYIAYFNRPADPVGLAYWTGSNMSLLDIAQGFSAQPEYTSTYKHLSTSQVVNTIYKNLFGREAEPAGLNFWTTQLATGAVTVGFAALTIQGSAVGTDRIAVESKVAAATALTNAVDTPKEIADYSGLIPNFAMKMWLGKVADTSTLAAALVSVDSTVLTIGGGWGGQGRDIVLTNDSVAPRIAQVQLNDTLFKALLAIGWMPSTPFGESLQIRVSDSSFYAPATTGLSLDATALTLQSPLAITLGRGANNIQTGAGSDRVVLLGNYVAGTYSGTENGIVLDSHTTLAATARVVTDTIDLGSGNDTLVTYGAISLAGTTIANVENIVSNSAVVITLSQYNALILARLALGLTGPVITFTGRGPHQLTIIDDVPGANSLDLSYISVNGSSLKLDATAAYNTAGGNTNNINTTGSVTALNGAVVYVGAVGTTPVNGEGTPTSQGPVQGPVSLSFVLTAGLDDITGGAANDTVTGTTATMQANDKIDGGGGVDTLNYANSSAAALPAATIKNVEIINVNATSNLNSTDVSGLTALTNFNADRATATLTVTNAGAGVQYGILGDNATLSPGSFNFGYGAGATVATLNLQNGVKSNAGTNVFITGAGITSTVINSTGAANSLSVAGTAGVIVTASSSTSITINASTNLTAALSTTNDTKLTVTGPGVVDLRGVNYGFQLNKNITTIDASAQTTGGTLIQAGNPSNANTLKFIGGGGNDSVGLGTVLAAGASLDGGAGTDTIRTNNATFITGVTGAFIKNFEVVDIAANITVDLDNLAANNSLTGLRLGGASNVVNNVTATVATNVTVYASGSPNLNLKNATNVGQIDTVKIDANDGLAAVNTINLGAPGLTGTEILNLMATDNIIISGLNNATSLTNIAVTGGATVSVNTGAVAVNSGMTVDASAANGNFTFNATSATGNGYTLKGSSGVNVLTGGSAPITVDLTQSTTKADQVIITSATGSAASVFQTISGFTNAVTTGDKLDVINNVTTAGNAGASSTGVSNLNGAINNGMITFSGTAASTATLQNKIDAAASLAGTTQYNIVAFEDAGSTYVFEQCDTTATYSAGVDLIVKLTGVTGVTALSTSASGAATVFVV